MYKIRTLNNISVKGLDRLPREHYEIGSEISAPDAILLRSADMHEQPIPDSLLAVGRAGAGVNNVPVAAMSEHGIPVFNAPGANANAVKELVLAGLFLACRNICAAWDFARQLEGEGEAYHKAIESGKKQFAGIELPDRVLGVVGLGAIGVAVANAARSLGMRVIGFDPQITVDRAWQLSADVEQAYSIEELLEKAQFVSFHVPLTDGTRHLLNRERLKHLNAQAVVLNFARDGIVEEAALCQALQNNRLRAYVTDFPTAETKHCPGVIALPHIGASTEEAQDNCAVMAAEQVRDYLENGNVVNSVNFPELRMPRRGVARLAVANRNVPDMLGQISHALGEAEANIVHMINESAGDVAYSLVDCDSALEPSIRAKIEAIPGVLRVRVI